ncbi:hypothetical protein PR002_g18440 [Phytophthora rubi]|uniref:Reverse transcriptase domain-containing protein n=1 Tax=Phytophthora rubi TaxID=129364 RepID=A0A6A3JVU2_9STRA|nr:hypothetical protein PR002_g18440 [Phytophthora rubi]
MRQDLIWDVINVARNVTNVARLIWATVRKRVDTQPTVIKYGVTATDKEIKTEEAGVTDTEVKTQKAGATDKEIKTEEAGVTDTEVKTQKAGATDEKIRTEEAGATDKEIKTEKAGATDEKIRTEEAGATDKEIKTEKAGATDEKIRTEEAGGKQGGVKDGGNLDAKGADSQVAKLPEVTTMTKEGKIEDAGDEQVCIKEDGDLYAEDVEGQLAMLPEVTTTTEDITIEDIQVGNPGEIDPEEIDRLRKITWRRRHLLVGKGNALPPAARGAICDIDVGNAKPVAQRVRKVAPQFREKLSQLLKGLLSARIIQNSTSPWASPIVVIIKKNGIDIRLYIDYRLINSLTRLMVYPMPLINDLLDDLDKVLWYCSLDMASGFWVVSMTDRARMISAFITPFGLFEWNRMLFGLKNAPQIYQRLIDNALYGFLKITNTQDRQAKNDPNEPNLVDLFKEGEPDEDKPTSVLGRRSYIDDILVTAGSWENLCEKVDKLLDACDEWNLYISVVKSFWGMKKVDYLGHRVSADGMEARPKDLSSLANLPFPTTLRSMQSFLGSLNYYSRFIEEFAIYASVLYELREADFFRGDQEV